MRELEENKVMGTKTIETRLTTETVFKLRSIERSNGLASNNNNHILE